MFILTSALFIIVAFYAAMLFSYGVFTADRPVFNKPVVKFMSFLVYNTPVTNLTDNSGMLKESEILKTLSEYEYAWVKGDMYGITYSGTLAYFFHPKAIYQRIKLAWGRL